MRELTSSELATIEAGGSVEPAYRRVHAAIELAARPSPENDDFSHLAVAALERVKQTKARSGSHASAMSSSAQAPIERATNYRTLRSFLLTWTELDG